jgi:hypothetical protein
MRTPDIIGRQDYGSIEGQKIPGETGAAPALPIDIILPHLEMFSFSGQVRRFLQGTRIFDDLNLDASKSHSCRMLQIPVTMSQSPSMH